MNLDLYSNARDQIRLPVTALPGVYSRMYMYMYMYVQVDLSTHQMTLTIYAGEWS